MVTADGGFNPTWQRHVAAYALSAGLLDEGRIVDIGCGIGHSYELLAPRVTVGVDVEPEVLAGQARETVVADMRRLPFADGSFDGAISVHSIEHVPDPRRAIAEMHRVLRPGASAVVVTPNRLTFARADEIIDPYHYIEFDPDEMRALCGQAFESVEIAGIFGSARYSAIVDAEQVKLDALLRLDPLRLRRLVPRRVRQRLYDYRLRSERSSPDPGAAAIVPGDFRVEKAELNSSLDVVAVCRKGDAPPG